METPVQHALMYVTAESRDEALALGRQLVEERLAACANVWDRMTSLYFWKDQLQQSDEAVLILKTRQDLIPRVTDRIQQLHSYDCPCVVALPLLGGNPEFLQWITNETIGAASPPIA